MIPDIDWFRNNAKVIHFFGLGFIQIKINDDERYHFYTNLLNKTINVEDIHDHRYDFASQILKGELNQKIYKIVDGDTHNMYQESCEIDSQESFIKECSIDLLKDETFVTNDKYSITHDIFHTVSANNTITKLFRSEYKKHLATVVISKNSPKVCPFSNNVGNDILWDIVRDMIIYE